MNAFFNFVRSEPATVAGVVGAGVTLLVAFGLHLTGAEIGAISAFDSAVLAVIVRGQVSPTDQG